MSKTIKILSTSDVHGFVYPTDFSSRDNRTELGLLKAGNKRKKMLKTMKLSWPLKMVT